MTDWPLKTPEPQEWGEWIRERGNDLNEDPAFEQGRSYLRDNGAQPLITALLAIAQRLEEENKRMRDLVREHWWVRTEDLGTYCCWCGARAHYDAAIWDIPHRDNCEYVRLTKERP